MSRLTACNWPVLGDPRGRALRRSRLDGKRRLSVKGWRLMMDNYAYCVRSSPFGGQAGADADRLIGVWKLISWQVIVANEQPRNEFGEHPKGYLILTREGRSIVLTTAENRRAEMDDAAMAALHRSMLAYSGRYRVEGNDFVTAVEVSWNESWNGTEQRRHFRIEGEDR